MKLANVDVGHPAQNGIPHLTSQILPLINIAYPENQKTP